MADLPSSRFNENIDDRYAPNYHLKIFSKGFSGIDFFTSSDTNIFGGIGQQDIIDAIKEKIVTVEYEDNASLYDTLKVTFRGSLIDSTGVQIPVPEYILREDLFKEGVIMVLRGGYGTKLSLIGGAEVVKREFTYTDDPSCTVIAYEPLHRMAQESDENMAVYRGLRSAQIVQKIGKKVAYDGPFGSLFNVDKINPLLPIFTPRAERQRAGESDYQFIDRMAKVRGWDFFTRFDEKTQKFDLRYGPDLDKKDSQFRYTYDPKQQFGSVSSFDEDKLLRFKPQISVIDQNSTISVISLDPKRKKKVEKTTLFNEETGSFASDDAAEKTKNPATYRADIFGISKVVVANKPFRNEAEVKKYVVRWARDKIKNYTTGSGNVMGNEELQTRSVQELGGLGERLSGKDSSPAKWYVTKVKHKFSGASNVSYESIFDVRRVIDWIPKDELSVPISVFLKEKEKKKKIGQFNAITGSFKE